MNEEFVSDAKEHLMQMPMQEYAEVPEARRHTRESNRKVEHAIRELMSFGLRVPIQAAERMRR